MIICAQKTSPCKDCTDRSATCHGSCERYKQYKAELEEYKNPAIAAREETDFNRGLTRVLRKTNHQRRKWRCYK